MYDKVNAVWPEWKTESAIGKGAFGEVYKVKREEARFTYEAAVKVIQIPSNQSEVTMVLNETGDEGSTKEYFENIVHGIEKECFLMSKLKGKSNIVSYEDHKVIKKKGVLQWEIYIRMELLKPLNAYVMEKGKITTNDIVQLGIDMCKALEECQQYQIIHRDIKPENIFISNSGEFKLGDFGVSRQLEKTSAGLSKAGTYSYMAPEVQKMEKYNATVDIYSLGIVLYQYLNRNRIPFLSTDSKIFTAEERNEANRRRFLGEKIPKPCDATEELAKIILKACEYHSKDRYQSAAEMRKALENQGVDEKNTSHKIKNLKLVWLCICITIGILGGSISYYVWKQQSRPVKVTSTEKKKSTEKTEESSFDTETTEEVNLTITCMADILLPGDEVNAYLHAGSLALQSSDRLKWSTTNEKVASVNRMGEIKALNQGKCQIQAKYDGKTTSKEMLVLNVDKTYGMTMRSNKDKIVFSEDSLTDDSKINLSFTLDGKIPDRFKAYYYYSPNLSLNCKWNGLKDGVLKLEVTDLGSVGEGVLTVYITPEGEDKVIGAAKIKVKGQ